MIDWGFVRNMFAVLGAMREAEQDPRNDQAAIAQAVDATYAEASKRFELVLLILRDDGDRLWLRLNPDTNEPEDLPYDLAIEVMQIAHACEYMADHGCINLLDGRHAFEIRSSGTWKAHRLDESAE